MNPGSKAHALLPRIAVVAHDLVMVYVCWQVLHVLRYLTRQETWPWLDFSPTVAWVLVAQGLVFWRVGLYRGLWRFASVPDLWNIFKAALWGLAAIILGLAVYNRLGSVPRSVLVSYPFVLTAMLGLPRLAYRMWKDHVGKRGESDARRVLILGAGRAADALVRDLHRTGAYQPVGFLDDAPRLRGSRLHGLPVLGRLEEAPAVARETAAGMLVIAMPSLDAAAMRRVMGICERTGLPFRMVPSLVDALEGQALPGELKEVAIEDLLGRKLTGETLYPIIHIEAEDIEVAIGVIKAGTTAATRFEITGMVGGKPAIVVEHITRVRGDLRPDWTQPAQPGGSYRIEITGEPSYVVDICPSSSRGDHNYAAILLAAGRIVNAIPDVVAAPPGLRTTLDLPLVTGRGTYRG